MSGSDDWMEPYEKKDEEKTPEERVIEDQATLDDLRRRTWAELRISELSAGESIRLTPRTVEEGLMKAAWRLRDAVDRADKLPLRERIDLIEELRAIAPTTPDGMRSLKSLLNRIDDFANSAWRPNIWDSGLLEMRQSAEIQDAVQRLRLVLEDTPVHPGGTSRAWTFATGPEG